MKIKFYFSKLYIDPRQVVIKEEIMSLVDRAQLIYEVTFLFKNSLACCFCISLIFVFSSSSLSSMHHFTQNKYIK